MDMGRLLHFLLSSPPFSSSPSGGTAIGGAGTSGYIKKKRVSISAINSFSSAIKSRVSSPGSVESLVSSDTVVVA